MMSHVTTHLKAVSFVCKPSVLHWHVSSYCLCPVPPCGNATVVRAMVGKNVMVTKRANKGIFLPKNGTFHSSGWEKPDGVLRRPTFLPFTHGERLRTAFQFLGQLKTLCGHSPPTSTYTHPIRPYNDVLAGCEWKYKVWCQIRSMSVNCWLTSYT